MIDFPSDDWADEGQADRVLPFRGQPAGLRADGRYRTTAENQTLQVPGGHEPTPQGTALLGHAYW